MSTKNQIIKKTRKLLFFLLLFGLLPFFSVSVEAYCRNTCNYGGTIYTSEFCCGCYGCTGGTHCLYICSADRVSIVLENAACSPSKDGAGNCGAASCYYTYPSVKDCSSTQICDCPNGGWTAKGNNGVKYFYCNYGNDAKCSDCGTCKKRDSGSCVVTKGAACGTTTCDSYSISGNSCIYNGDCTKTCSDSGGCSDCTCATSTQINCSNQCTELAGCSGSGSGKTSGSCPNKAAGSLCTGGKCYSGACDTANPATTISPNGANWTNKNVNFTLTCTDSGGTGTASGCKQIKYKIINNATDCSTDASPWNTTSVSGATATILGIVNCSSYICEKKVCFRSMDNAENEEAPKESSAFQIEKILPYIVDVSHYPLSVKVNEKINLTSYANDSESGIKNITIYVDNTPAKNCSKSSCNMSITYENARGHTYHAIAYDNAGNFNQSIPGTQFTINGNPEMNCSSNTNNTGTICIEGEYCVSGVFVDSSDGGEGNNTGTSSPDGARCCAGSGITQGVCGSQYILPLCSGPPLYGTEYNPSVAECKPPYSEIYAKVEDILSLRCCSGTPTLKDDIFEVYWSRQTSGFFKLTEAAEGDYLYCIAKGVPSASFVIIKSSKTESGSAAKESDGLAKWKVVADETGKMQCNATSGSNNAAAMITITETGKNENSLPFFGLFQFIIALAAIIIYCRVKLK